jgi:FtsZ-interacting cell division protein YlmF
MSLMSLMSLRSFAVRGGAQGLATGDHRALYLAWLLCAQGRELDDDAIEPPVPAGLGELTAPLQAFADFFRIDADLLTVAAARSPEAEASASEAGVEPWIAALPDVTKTDWLVRLAGGKEPHLRAEMLRRFRESQPPREPRHAEAPRTVRELLDGAEKRTQERRREEAERAAAERALREQKAAEQRQQYLDNLANREPEAWERVDALIATKQPGRYDDAVKLLSDLRDLAHRDGRKPEVEARLRRLSEQHAKKPTFIERLTKAGLLPKA